MPLFVILMQLLWLTETVHFSSLKLNLKIKLNNKIKATQGFLFRVQKPPCK